MSLPVKNDKDKPRLDLLPFDALDEVAKVYNFGAVKYAERNWDAGMEWHRYFRAALSHLWKWWQGEDRDHESGLSHLTHATFNVLALLTYELRKIGKDDRPHRPSGLNPRFEDKLRHELHLS
jgi:hypothetical protein